MLPLHYIQAVARSRARIHASTLSDQLTLADDGWDSRREVHYAAVTIGMPLVPSETIALSRIQPTEPHGVAGAKAREQPILIGDRAAPLAEYPAGFALPLPMSPSAFVLDSPGPNIRARAIASWRHPGVVFIPCFAHIFALLCGDYLTASRYPTVRGSTQSRHKVAYLLPTRSRCLDHLYSLSLFTGSLQYLQRPLLHGVPHNNTSTGDLAGMGATAYSEPKSPR
jgi:hypothetical protein